MADLLIGVDDDLLIRLRERAAEHGRSLELEIKFILERADMISVARTHRFSDEWLRPLAGT